MLTNILRALVYELFLKIFYGWMIKKLIFFLKTFNISYESDVKKFPNIVH